MSINFNVTEQDSINLHKETEQQKNERAVENKKRFSKQTFDEKIAEYLSPVTKKIRRN